MEKPHFVFGGVVWVVLFFTFLHGKLMVNAETSETWGYVEVRPKAHMFWILYKSSKRPQCSEKPWPIILWLQGGPGGSGVGIGNFQEIGPLDTELKPRNYTWLSIAHLLFVDSPVGTGYSFVENGNTELLSKTDDEAALDLTTLLKAIFNNNTSLRKCPLYIVAESYGGKFAVSLGLLALQAIKAGELRVTLGGVVLGDAWISPQDYVLSWAPLLKDMSRLDNNGFVGASRLANKIKQQLVDHNFANATDSWGDLEEFINRNTNYVSFYNLLLDEQNDQPLSSTTFKSLRRYSTHLLDSSNSDESSLDKLMNGYFKKKLGIIPKNVTWGGQSDLVFEPMTEDFMKPKINEVDKLLAKGINVTVYNGQLDLICSTMGTEAWVEKLNWTGIKTFLGMRRKPIYNWNRQVTKGFTKSYQNLNFYWILMAGHFVHVDQPSVALDMITNITHK